MTQIGAELYLAPEASDLQLDRIGVGPIVQGQDLDGDVLTGAELDRGGG
jgi:hypothetical protein